MKEAAITSFRKRGAETANDEPLESTSLRKLGKRGRLTRADSTSEKAGGKKRKIRAQGGRNKWEGAKRGGEGLFFGKNGFVAEDKGMKGTPSAGKWD